MAEARAAAKPKMMVQGATKFYQTRTGAVHALDDVSIEVREGEFLCIIGPSGCGKTTLLWSMAGLHDLTAGEIRLDGQTITGPHPEIAMIFTFGSTRRSSLIVPRPSSSGMTMSMITTSHRWRRYSRTATLPFDASSTSYPARTKI